MRAFAIPYKNEEARAVAKEAGAKWHGGTKTWQFADNATVPADLAKFEIEVGKPDAFVFASTKVTEAAKLLRDLRETIVDGEVPISEAVKNGAEGKDADKLARYARAMAAELLFAAGLREEHKLIRSKGV